MLKWLVIEVPVVAYYGRWVCWLHPGDMYSPSIEDLLPGIEVEVRRV